MKIIHNIRRPIEESSDDIFSLIKKTYGLSAETPMHIYRQSVDCRHGKISKVYSVAIDTDVKNPDFTELEEYVFCKTPRNQNLKVVIVGMGPAGLFCAKTLSDNGLCPTIIDRGEPVEKRVDSVNLLWTENKLSPESNVQFGEGGAGTFSDGKLTCRKNDPRSRKILKDFISFGAPKEIETEALPHIGTDCLRKTVRNMREDLIKKGVRFLYNAKFYDFETDSSGNITSIETTVGRIECDALVLAIGNGAFDTFEKLIEKYVFTETKPMSFGVRQEHLQTDVNRAIYGKYSDDPRLPKASYSFYTHLDKQTCVYTFCMCPGGKVVNSSSLPERLTVNGMSDYSRNGTNANSALLVSYSPKSIAEALAFQRKTEENAFRVAKGAFPISASLTEKSSASKIVPTVLPKYEFADFSDIFPEKMTRPLEEGAAQFHKKIFGTYRFESPIYTAPETRTSSPLRIKRDKDTLRSLSHENLYPCGEGAGYAGGIMSSAIDGIKVAEKILSDF